MLTSTGPTDALTMVAPLLWVDADALAAEALAAEAEAEPLAAEADPLEAAEEVLADAEPLDDAAGLEAEEPPEQAARPATRIVAQSAITSFFMFSSFLAQPMALSAIFPGDSLPHAGPRLSDNGDEGAPASARIMVNGSSMTDEAVISETAPPPEGGDAMDNLKRLKDQCHHEMPGEYAEPQSRITIAS